MLRIEQWETSAREVSGPERDDVNRAEVGEVRAGLFIEYFSSILGWSLPNIGDRGRCDFTTCNIFMLSTSFLDELWLPGTNPANFGHLRRWRQQNGSGVPERFAVSPTWFLGGLWLFGASLVSFRPRVLPWRQQTGSSFRPTLQG